MFRLGFSDVGSDDNLILTIIDVFKKANKYWTKMHFLGTVYYFGIYEMDFFYSFNIRPDDLMIHYES